MEELESLEVLDTAPSGAGRGGGASLKIGME
jgi:hypothetical protein